MDFEAAVVSHSAEQAASLASDLHKSQAICQNRLVTEEISNVSTEVTNLYGTLREMYSALEKDQVRYTEAFNEDLQEILTELTAVFEEISDCCVALQSVDCDMSSVAWFFRKGRVARLLKHLQTLEGTLLIMQIVLKHGREYRLHSSDRVAESDPHTMGEDYKILESILARNKDTINELRNFANAAKDANGVSPSARKRSRAGDHYRKMSDSTGVQVSHIPDVLPLGTADQFRGGTVKRTFTKRAITPLHMSLLNLGTHEASCKLKDKWLLKPQFRHEIDNEVVSGRRYMIPPELSRISEVDTTSYSQTNLRASDSCSLPNGMKDDQASKDTPVKATVAPTTTPLDQSNSITRELASPGLSGLRRILSKLTFQVSPVRVRDRGQRPAGDKPEGSRSVLNMKEDADKSEVDMMYQRTFDDIESAESSPPTRVTVGGLQRHKSFLELIKQRFQPSARGRKKQGQKEG